MDVSEDRRDRWADNPAQSKKFETERFVVVPLSGAQARRLLCVLLQDELLAAQVEWLRDKSLDGVEKEAFRIELLCNAGRVKVWSIVERARKLQIGAVLATFSLNGLDLEIVVASQFWDQGVSAEVAEPVAQWLENIGSNFDLARYGV
jgi:RimJ/RimL family protein N-acetyltransferase